MAPKAPTKRKMSCALQRAWAAVKMGISNTGVPTKRRRSRQRSRIQTEAFAVGCAGDSPAPETLDADTLAEAKVCVAISRLINQKNGENKPALEHLDPGFPRRKAKGGWHFRHPPDEFLP